MEAWYRVGAVRAVVHAQDVLKEVTIIFLTSTLVSSQVKQQGGKTVPYINRNRITDLLSMALAIRTRPSFSHWGKSRGKTDERVSLSHQESLYPYPSEGRQDENHKHRKLINLITWTTSLYNSMKQ